MKNHRVFVADFYMRTGDLACMISTTHTQTPHHTFISECKPQLADENCYKKALS